jgi:hypothetical protein
MSKERQKHRSFIDLYVGGEVLPEEIDDYVDQWHDNPGRRQLHDFLGMTEDEYSLWLRDPDVLPHIARARREHKPIVRVIESALNELPMAARSSDVAEIRRLRKWLAREGKID